MTPSHVPPRWSDQPSEAVTANAFPGPSAAHHLNRPFAATFRGDAVSLRSAPQARRLRVGDGGRANIRWTLLVRHYVSRLIIALVPRCTGPHHGRCVSMPKTCKGGGVDAPMNRNR